MTDVTLETATAELRRHMKARELETVVGCAAAFYAQNEALKAVAVTLAERRHKDHDHRGSFRECSDYRCKIARAEILEASLR